PGSGVHDHILPRNFLLIDSTTEASDSISLDNRGCQRCQRGASVFRTPPRVSGMPRKASRPQAPVSRGRATLSMAAATALVVLTAQLIGATPAHAATMNLTQYVNPFIGSDDSNSPNPVGGGAGGSTVPGPVVPFGMVQLSPDTPTASPSGYRFSDTSIEEFSLTHFNGAGCPNNEDLGILPITGAIGASPGTSWTSYRATQ